MQSTVFPVPPYAKVLSVTVGSVLSHLEMVCLKLHGALDGAVSAARAPAAFPAAGDEEAARAVDTVNIAATSTDATTTSRLLDRAETFFMDSPPRVIPADCQTVQSCHAGASLTRSPDPAVKPEMSTFAISIGESAGPHMIALSWLAMVCTA